ncbi:hypothetical protein EX30DRAFT_79037 [Ascodesmis nigricans]|uniref:DNA topoisomerase I n=1 Tax=Ascodesmis nigricans TaxID=341454 RepID=A0A4S2MSY6_9PEZI|nr:hypothetical protein EX30DRAFT_79037 [Ascodesmis nigricans]
MSSSDDDVPLAIRGRPNGSSPKSKKASPKPKSPERITKAMEKRLDDEMDLDTAGDTGGIGITVTNTSTRPKRKSTKPAVKNESSDSDVPLTKRRKPNGTPLKSETDSDDDVPLASRRGAAAAKKPSPKAEKAEESDSDAPLLTSKLSPAAMKMLQKEKVEVEKKAAETAKAIRAEKNLPTGKRKLDVRKEEESDDDVPLAGRKKVAQKKAKTGKTTAKKVVKKASARAGKGKAGKGDGEEEEEEAGYAWWQEQTESDGKTKWTTLEHNGVMFPPPYQRLPRHVKMRYDGVPLTLPEAAEEVAGFFGAMLTSEHVKNKVFCDNFFGDFLEVLEESGGAQGPDGQDVDVTDFNKCDFTPMFEYFEAKREERNQLTVQQKKDLKAERDALEEPYLYCRLDGRKEKVGNFKVEPPGLFRGRGEHPKTGKLKKRVMPEQVTINIGEEAKVPAPPPGHKWKSVVHKQDVTWLAMWTENVNDNVKYVMLAATSSLKGQSDFKKFEKARELKGVVDIIRKDYERELRDKSMVVRQRATAMYLIDKLALRAGNAKGEEEADTVGCCSLKVSNITLRKPNLVTFDFLGKDSIRYYNEVAVDPQVFTNLRLFKARKDGADELFDRITTQSLNKHLTSYLKGLTAKVFRTYNASWTMQIELAKIPAGGSVHDKVAAYHLANKTVAVLCNHQRGVPANFAQNMQRAIDRVKGLRYQKLRLKRQIAYLDPKRVKKMPDYFKPDPEIQEDFDTWVVEHQKLLIEQEREKIHRKFEKDNEKQVSDGKPELKEKELNERLKALKEMEKEFEKENKTGKVEPKTRSCSIEKIEEQIKKMDEKIKKAEMENHVKDENKTIALGTSKLNYIDPRLTVMFCNKHNVPLDKFFPKTMRDKFKWAIESADETFEF